MQRLRQKETWSLFDPCEVPLLLTTFGAAFTAAYQDYERTVVPLERVPSRDLWNVICRAQQETGTPFLMYQDNINGKQRSLVAFPTLTVSSLCSQKQPPTSWYHSNV